MSNTIKDVIDVESLKAKLKEITKPYIKDNQDIKNKVIELLRLVNTLNNKARGYALVAGRDKEKAKLLDYILGVANGLADFTTDSKLETLDSAGIVKELDRQIKLCEKVSHILEKEEQRIRKDIDSTYSSIGGDEEAIKEAGLQTSYLDTASAVKVVEYYIAVWKGFSNDLDLDDSDKYGNLYSASKNFYRFIYLNTAFRRAYQYFVKLSIIWPVINKKIEEVAKIVEERKPDLIVKKEGAIGLHVNEIILPGIEQKKQIDGSIETTPYKVRGRLLDVIRLIITKYNVGVFKGNEDILNKYMGMLAEYIAVVLNVEGGDAYLENEIKNNESPLRERHKNLALKVTVDDIKQVLYEFIKLRDENKEYLQFLLAFGYKGPDLYKATREFLLKYINTLSRRFNIGGQERNEYTQIIELAVNFISNQLPGNVNSFSPGEDRIAYETLGKLSSKAGVKFFEILYLLTISAYTVGVYAKIANLFKGLEKIYVSLSYWDTALSELSNLSRNKVDNVFKELTGQTVNTGDMASLNKVLVADDTYSIFADKDESFIVPKNSGVEKANKLIKQRIGFEQDDGLPEQVVELDNLDGDFKANYFKDYDNGLVTSTIEKIDSLGNKASSIKGKELASRMDKFKMELLYDEDGEITHGYVSKKLMYWFYNLYGMFVFYIKLLSDLLKTLANFDVLSKLLSYGMIMLVASLMISYFFVEDVNDYIILKYGNFNQLILPFIPVQPDSGLMSFLMMVFISIWFVLAVVITINIVFKKVPRLLLAIANQDRTALKIGLDMIKEFIIITIGVAIYTYIMGYSL